jgi:diacylglycerol kinase family enzyme
LDIVGHLRSIWNGTYRSPTIQDFWVDAVRLEFSKPVPFQVGGDAVGYREEMEFRLSSKSVRLVDLHRPAQETLH